MTTLISLLHVLRRRGGLILAIFVLVSAGAVAGVYLKRPTYESSAKLLINLDGRGVSLSRADVQYGSTHVQAVEAITSQVEVLRSRELVEKLVDNLGIDSFREPPPSSFLLRLVAGAIDEIGEAVTSMLRSARLIDPISPRNALIERIEKGLRIYPVRQAQVIIVSFQWRNARIPPLVLGELLDLYLAKIVDINGRSDGYDLFLEQVRRASAELETAERELRDLELRYEIVDLRREKQLLLERMEKLTTMADGAGVPALPDRGQDRPVIDAASADQEATIVGAQIAHLRSQLNALKIERAKALITYTHDHRQIRELDNQIAATEAVLANETKLLLDTIAAYRSRLRTLQAVEKDFNRVARNLEIATEAYQTYRKVSEDRRVMKAQETKVRVQVVDPPSTPFRPLGPSRLLLVLAGLILAFCIAVGWALLVDLVARRRLLGLLNPGAQRDETDRLAESFSGPAHPARTAGIPLQNRAPETLEPRF